MRLFGAIEKFDKREDGTLLVSGIASSDSLDNEGQQITADAMRAALPDFMRFGNIREMHDDHSAAGVCLSAAVMPDGKTHIETLIVDPVAVKKVLTGVYKGFSIGGEPLSVQGKAITRLRLSEISLCDRPVNPECRLDLWKATKSHSPIMIESKNLAKSLGLAETATEAELLDAISKAKTPVAPVVPDIAGEIAKALKASGLEGVTAQFKALEDKIDASHKDSIAKAEKAERVSLVEQAGREGKVIPLDDDTIFGNTEKKVEAIPLSALKTIVAKAQKSVAVSALAPKTIKQGDVEVDIETLRKTGFEKPEDRKAICKAAKAKTPGQWNEFFARIAGQPQN